MDDVKIVSLVNTNVSTAKTKVCYFNSTRKWLDTISQSKNDPQHQSRSVTWPRPYTADTALTDRVTSVTRTGWTGFGRTQVYEWNWKNNNRLLLVSGEMQDCLHEFISLLSWQRALSFHIICSHLSQLLVTLRQHRPRPRWKATNEYISCASTGIMLTHAPISWYLFTRTHLETSRTSVTPRLPRCLKPKQRRSNRS